MEIYLGPSSHPNAASNSIGSGDSTRPDIAW